jgi:hypothetical protein
MCYGYASRARQARPPCVLVPAFGIVQVFCWTLLRSARPRSRIMAAGESRMCIKSRPMLRCLLPTHTSDGVWLCYAVADVEVVGSPHCTVAHAHWQIRLVRSGTHHGKACRKLSMCRSCRSYAAGRQAGLTECVAHVFYMYPQIDRTLTEWMPALLIHRASGCGIGARGCLSLSRYSSPCALRACPGQIWAWGSHCKHLNIKQMH